MDHSTQSNRKRQADQSRPPQQEHRRQRSQEEASLGDHGGHQMLACPPELAAYLRSQDNSQAVRSKSDSPSGLEVEMLHISGRPARNTGSQSRARMPHPAPEKDDNRLRPATYFGDTRSSHKQSQKDTRQQRDSTPKKATTPKGDPPARREPARTKKKGASRHAAGSAHTREMEPTPPSPLAKRPSKSLSPRPRTGKSPSSSPRRPPSGAGRETPELIDLNVWGRWSPTYDMRRVSQRPPTSSYPPEDQSQQR